MSQVEKSVENITIENIINEVGFGKFQIINYVYILVTILCTTIAALLFVFTARDTTYRCLIPLCESSPTVYDEEWLLKAIPTDYGVLNKCEYFAANISTVPEEILVDELENNTCDMMKFDNSKIEKCDKWVYGEGDSIVKEFGIPCEGWKLSLVGTVNGVGQMVSLLFSGFLTDKYGRRNIMAILAALMGVIGLAQSFLPEYWSFLVFEFLIMLVVRGVNTAAYIFAIEVLSIKQRIFGCAFIEITSTSASVILGLMAWASPSWKILIRATMIPMMLVPFAVLMIPESFRWLKVKGRIAETEAALKKAALSNNKTLSQSSILRLEELSSQHKNDESCDSENITFFTMFTSRRLTIRIIACSTCWFGNVMLYYGLFLNSVTISNSNNVYLNFIYVALCEYASILMYMLILRFMPRKWSLFINLLGTAIFCVIYAFIPKTTYVLPLVIYLVTKILSSTCFKMLYIYTSEMFPTSLRSSSMSLCSLIARIGGSLAPQVPLLAVYHPALPMCCYGIVAGLSAFTAFGMPETKNKKLPDTIAEAEELR